MATAAAAMALPQDWFAVSAGDTLADATALGRHPQAPHVGADSSGRGGVEMHRYARVQHVDGVNSGSGAADAATLQQDSGEEGGCGKEDRPLLRSNQDGDSDHASHVARPNGDSGSAADSGGREEYQREIADVRQLMKQAGNPPSPRLVWELSQRLKRAAGRYAVQGGEAHEALTEECVRLRLLSRQLRRQQKRAAAM